MPTTCTPVSQRIQELEGGIYYLTLQLTYAGKTQSDRNRVDAELRVSLQALEHYRKALEFEGELQAQRVGNLIADFRLREQADKAQNNKRRARAHDSRS
jgi:hypothetical protein